MAGGPVLPAGRPRLLPGRQEGPAADRVRPAHRPAGRPVAVRVLPGNAADPQAFTEIVKAMRETFKLSQMVMVGDRGMITKARIDALNTAEDGTELEPADRYG